MPEYSDPKNKEEVVLELLESLPRLNKLTERIAVLRNQTMNTQEITREQHLESFKIAKEGTQFEVLSFHLQRFCSENLSSDDLSHFTSAMDVCQEHFLHIIDVGIGSKDYLGNRLGRLDDEGLAALRDNFGQVVSILGQDKDVHDGSHLQQARPAQVGASAEKTASSQELL